jgi:CRISPR/Cas system-associated endoribonuclease Cas2
MLVLLADTRKKLLWLWLAFTAAISILFLIQTISGKLEDIESTAWLWLFINILPCLVLLFVAVLWNKNASKVLLVSTFRAVYASAWAYLLLLLATLLALPFATVNSSIEDYLKDAYLWLIPFQVILMVVFSLLYFRKETLLRPNAAIMQEYVSKKAEFAKRAGNDSQNTAFNALINNADLTEVLTHLRTHLADNKNDIIVLQSQYVNWQKERDLNLSPPDVLQRELNRLTMAVVNYIEDL